MPRSAKINVAVVLFSALLQLNGGGLSRNKGSFNVELKFGNGKQGSDGVSDKQIVPGHPDEAEQNGDVQGEDEHVQGGINTDDFKSGGKEKDGSPRLLNILERAVFRCKEGTTCPGGGKNQGNDKNKKIHTDPSCGKDGKGSKQCIGKRKR